MYVLEKIVRENAEATVAVQQAFWPHSCSRCWSGSHPCLLLTASYTRVLNYKLRKRALVANRPEAVRPGRLSLAAFPMPRSSRVTPKKGLSDEPTSSHV